MIKDIATFLKNISFIDYVFFFTVVFLIVLIVCLIYFIKVNEDIIESDEKLNDPDNLKEITSSIKKEIKPITFTSYEKEQEDKAIISYDELLSNTGEFKLNYIDEEQKGDLSVKKFDLNNLVSNVQQEPKTTEIHEVHLMQFSKEEEFLKTLKELQKLLN